MMARKGTKGCFRVIRTVYRSRAARPLVEVALPSMRAWAPSTKSRMSVFRALVFGSSIRSKV